MSDRQTPRTGHIQTVSGLIAPTDLGPTLMHEHLLLDVAPPSMRAARSPGDPTVQASDCFKLNWGQLGHSDNYRLDQREVMAAELREMHAAGGRSLVELTVGGLEPDPVGLVELAEKSGIHIIMGCGHYVEEYQSPDIADRTPDEFAREMIEHVTVGAWGTPVRAGIIGEIGCQAPWTDREKRVMRGAVMAQAETGASLNAHPGRSDTQPFELAAFARAAGAPMERFIISHIERTLFELGDLLRLAETGCVIEFDLFGFESNYIPEPEVDLPNDARRTKLIRGLIDRGHIDQIVISHDICTKNRLCRYGGHGYQHIFANIIPMMLQRNFTQDQINQILVRNPARLLTFV
jgi:phosphotriesterase-related protein